MRVQELETYIAEADKREQDIQLRARAEIENIRRRAEQDVEKAHKFALEKFSKEMLKLRFSKDESGKFHYEKLIKDKIKDKSFEAKLLHFLLDEEDFVKKATSKVKVETSRNFLELMNVKPKESGSKQSNNSDKSNDVDYELLKELGL